MPAETGRCGQRLIWPAEVLRAQGADVVVAHGRDDPAYDERFDVAVIQRPMLRRLVEGVSPFEPVGVIRRLQADGIRVVVDIDDDFTALNRKNDVWDRVHPTRSPDCNWQHLTEACRQADLVTVTTPRLAAVYGGHGRVAIIPNHIPASYLSIPRPSNPVPLVGWTGAVKTHPDDLQVTRGGVAKAVRVCGAQFGVVGPAEGVQAHLWLDSAPVLVQERLGLPVEIDGAGIPRPGWVDINAYGLAAAQIDVGIVPLELTAFNQAKSWLKMMEFTALGVPCVGSPTDPNREFAARYGLPLAGKPRDWERWVTRLVTDEALRVEMSEAGREAMRAETVEANAGQWWDAWERAYGRRQERRTA